MLEVQKYLQSGKTLADLETELGIGSVIHPILPLAILNYSQIDSPKTHPIVRNCRGLVLNTTDWSLVSRAFQRFYNWGEVVEEMNLFNFKNFMTLTKEDGSLVNLFNFNGQWMGNTRGSFAQSEMQGCAITWQEGFCQALGVSHLNQLKLDPKLSYIAEFCSPFNKVVRHYPKPVMYLLTVFEGEDELSWDVVDDIAKLTPFLRPERFHFSSIEDIQEHIQKIAKNDPTYEGVVICDDQGFRWKLKSGEYLALHRLRGEGDNLFMAKNLLPFILSGETDELLVYFSEVKPALEYYEEQVKSFQIAIANQWELAKNEPYQKSFALKVKDHEFSGTLFTARKMQEDPIKVFRANPSMILKHLKPFKLTPVQMVEEKIDGPGYQNH